MKLEHTMATTVSHETYEKVSKMIVDKMVAGEKINAAIILREALEMYLANGHSAPVVNKPDNDKDNEQVVSPPADDAPPANNPITPPETTSKNPFADLIS